MLSIIVSPLRPAQKAEAQGQAPNSTSTDTPTATPTTIPEMAVTPPGEAPTATPEGAPEREVTETQDFVTSAELIPAESWRAPEDITWVMFRSETDATSLHDWRRTQGGAQSGEWKYTHSDLGTPRNHTMYEWTWAVDSIPPDAQVHLVFFVTSNDSGSVPPVEEMDLLRMYFRRLRDGLREPVTIVAAHVVAGSWFAIDLDRTADWVVLNKEKFGLDVVADVRGQVASEFSLDSWGVYYVAPAGSTPTPTATSSPTPAATPTATAMPTRTPSPTPIATPTVAEDTLWLATPAPVVQVDTEGDVCKVAHIPSAGGTGLASAQNPESWPGGSPQVPALTQCYSPSHIASIPPGACLNPTRRLVVKQTMDGSMAWSVEYLCPTQTQGAVMMTSTAATNPIVGPAVALAVLTMAALSSPTTVEVVFEPAGQAIAQGGSFIAANIQEGLDAVLALAVKPSTLYLGQPVVYAQIFDGQDIAGVFRGYRSSTNWEETVWAYPASAGVDGDTVAALQYFTEGSRGAVLKTVIYKTRPNAGAGYPLWDANVQMFLDGYPANPLYPGLPPRTGEHSDKTPAETARKRWGYNEYMNKNYEYRQAGMRPPHRWCGIRPSDGACSCVDYTIQVIRWEVNGVGKVKIKIYEGTALVWSSNPTVLMGLTQRVAGAAPFTDGAKPMGNQWNEYRTVDLNSPDDLNHCPDHFGLRLAGRADQGIPASMLPEGGETQ